LRSGDIQPPPGSNFLKFTNGRTFTNLITTVSNRVISAPPSGPQAHVPQALKNETLDIVNDIMPSIQREDRPVAYWRLCWDSITPAQDQLITRHPDERLNNLYLAIGGSFHSWKFLPIIGKYVANVLNGVSNGTEKDSRWEWKLSGWSSGGSRGPHEKAIPQRELRDMKSATRL
jgi:sarcosine oxidase/L-pipecolate oxidase